MSRAPETEKEDECLNDSAFDHFRAIGQKKRRHFDTFFLKKLIWLDRVIMHNPMILHDPATKTIPSGIRTARLAQDHRTVWSYDLARYLDNNERQYFVS